MNTIEIIRTDGPLHRRVWRFSYEERTHTLRVYTYREEVRISTRHRKWEPKEYYERFRSRATTLAAPPLPDDVRDEAKRVFTELLQVED